MERRKIVIAATTNITPFLNANPHFSEIHWWAPADRSVYVLVMQTHNRAEAHIFLTGNSAVPIAPHTDPFTQVGTAFATLIPAAFGVLATDTTWQAAKKIAAGAGWSAIDPAEF